MRLALAMGRTVKELKRSMTHAEWIDWVALYRIDPWGDQRADLRSAQIAWAAMAPHCKTPPDPASFLLFPEDRLDIPEDLSEQEQRWMLELSRKG